MCICMHVYVFVCLSKVERDRIVRSLEMKYVHMCRKPQFLDMYIHTYVYVHMCL